jgi:hypothetical protein
VTASTLDINLRGFGDTGLPPLLSLARFNISSVNFGNSSYSRSFIVWASIRPSKYPKQNDRARA